MEVFAFYFFGALTVLAALGVLFHPNPVFCALHLVGSMVGVAGLFFLLQAPFIASVQLAVYAGAVMVLFLIVVMLFDLTTEKESDFSKGSLLNLLKIMSAGVFTSLATFHVVFKYFGKDESTAEALVAIANVPGFEVRNIAKILFTDYVLVFEVLGLLLLVVPVGTVALSRIKGGTHGR